MNQTTFEPGLVNATLRFENSVAQLKKDGSMVAPNVYMTIFDLLYGHNFIVWK